MVQKCTCCKDMCKCDKDGTTLKALWEANGCKPFDAVYAPSIESDSATPASVHVAAITPSGGVIGWWLKTGEPFMWRETAANWRFAPKTARKTVYVTLYKNGNVNVYHTPQPLETVTFSGHSPIIGCRRHELEVAEGDCDQ